VDFNINLKYLFFLDQNSNLKDIEKCYFRPVIIKIIFLKNLKKTILQKRYNVY